MKLKTRNFAIESKEPRVILNSVDAEKEEIHPGDRVIINTKDITKIAIVDIADSLVSPGEIGILRSLQRPWIIEDNIEVNVSPLVKPKSLEYIKKKLIGQRLNEKEIYQIIEDIVDGRLSDLEIAAFVVAENTLDLSDEELTYLSRAMADTGEKIDWDRTVYDKHSIGGVPGNKVTLLIVPIVAAAGLLIPKTSSRAITSPSGTADTMETLADVSFTAEELKEIATKTNGAIIWGGGLNLAPADDLIIHVEHPLDIDPEPQLIASIVSKKLATGVDFLVLDLPMGRGTKLPSESEARRFAARFIKVTEKLGIKTAAAITYGTQPVGHAIGPALEAKEALETLMGSGPGSLIEKSTGLAGMLLEMAGIASPGNGKDIAYEILKSGKAYQKMKEIIEAQGGNPEIKPDELPIGDKQVIINAPNNGYITEVDNTGIKMTAVIAGAPLDKGAGVLLHAKVGYKVNKGDPLLTIYSNSSSRLEQAHKFVLQNNPILVESMILEKIGHFTKL